MCHTLWHSEGVIGRQNVLTQNLGLWPVIITIPAETWPFSLYLSGNTAGSFDNLFSLETKLYAQEENNY